MPLDEIPPQNDVLMQATAALRNSAIAVGPMPRALAELEQVERSRRRPMIVRVARAVAAALVFAVIGYLLFPRTGTLAFAEVAKSVAETRSFTATIRFQANPPIHLSVKGSHLRLESDDSLVIFDGDSGAWLRLIPSRHFASLTRTGQVQFDLYGMVRDYQADKAKPLGEKLLNGRKAEGFQVTRAPFPEGDQSVSWIFWVDPQTKLPVQVESGAAQLNDLHFNVPLDDALFSMSAPPGYTLNDELKKPGDLTGFDYAGQVVDARGKPIAGVEVDATYRDVSGGGYGYIGVERTGADGRFSIHRDTAQSGASIDGVKGLPVWLEFQHPAFVYARMEKVNALPAEQRTELHIILEAGKTVSGTALDNSGNPVPGALVQAVFAKDPDRRKAVASDKQGRFELRGLPPVMIDLEARTTDPASVLLAGHAPIDLKTATQANLTLQPVHLPEGKSVHHLLGMTLLDLTAEIQSQLFLFDAKGVMLLDRGPDRRRLAIGELIQGDSFWMVGQTRVGDFDEFVDHLVSECESQRRAGRSSFFVRVVYNFQRAGQDGSNTQYMSLTPDDLAELKKASGP